MRDNAPCQDALSTNFNITYQVSTSTHVLSVVDDYHLSDILQALRFDYQQKT